jgi:hypothetical protein
VVVNRGFDPPQRICRKPRTTVGLEARSRDHETEISLGDDVSQRKAISAIAARNLCGQPEVAGNEGVRSAPIALLMPSPCKLLFLPSFEQAVSCDG